MTMDRDAMGIRVFSEKLGMTSPPYIETIWRVQLWVDKDGILASGTSMNAAIDNAIDRARNMIRILESKKKEI
jgi:hypothetical protein